MPRQTISGIHDCAKSLSIKRECSIAVAKGIIHDVLDVMVEEIIRLGGVQFIDKFTIKQYFRCERQGSNPITGEPMSIPAKNALKFSAGKGLLDRLNPPQPTVKCRLPSLGQPKRFKPRFNINKVAMYSNDS